MHGSLCAFLCFRALYVLIIARPLPAVNIIFGKTQIGVLNFFHRFILLYTEIYHNNWTNYEWNHGFCLMCQTHGPVFVDTKQTCTSVFFRVFDFWLDLQRLFVHSFRKQACESNNFYVCDCTYFLCVWYFSLQRTHLCYNDYRKPLILKDADQYE